MKKQLEDYSHNFKDAFGNPLIIGERYAVASTNGSNYSFAGSLQRVTEKGTAIIDSDIIGYSNYYNNMKIMKGHIITQKVKCNQLIRYK